MIGALSILTMDKNKKGALQLSSNVANAQGPGHPGGSGMINVSNLVDAYTIRCLPQGTKTCASLDWTACSSGGCPTAGRDGEIAP